MSQTHRSLRGRRGKLKVSESSMAVLARESHESIAAIATKEDAIVPLCYYQTRQPQQRSPNTLLYIPQQHHSHSYVSLPLPHTTSCWQDIPVCTHEHFPNPQTRPLPHTQNGPPYLFLPFRDLFSRLKLVIIVNHPLLSPALTETGEK